MVYKMIRVRVTLEQYELICSKANYYGFTTISAYLRDVALKDICYIKMLREIYKRVCK